MSSLPDTNQASEDELEKPSERKKLFDKLIFMFGWKGETRRTKANKMMKIIDQYTETIIRTEKLKLLTEVREQTTIFKIKAHDTKCQPHLYEAGRGVPPEVLDKLEAEL